MDGVWLASTEVSVDVSVAVRVIAVGGKLAACLVGFRQVGGARHGPWDHSF